jgi:hypothetical protein
MQNSLKYELHNILSGKSEVRFGTTIQTIAGYLKNGETAGSRIENEKHFKSEETKRLEDWITQNHLWLISIDLSQYVSEGAEQKVFLKDTENVLKLNDSIIILLGQITFTIYYSTIIFFQTQRIN